MWRFFLLFTLVCDIFPPSYFVTLVWKIFFTIFWRFFSFFFQYFVIFRGFVSWIFISSYASLYLFCQNFVTFSDFVSHICVFFTLVCYFLSLLYTSLSDFLNSLPYFDTTLWDFLNSFLLSLQVSDFLWLYFESCICFFTICHIFWQIIGSLSFFSLVSLFFYTSFSLFVKGLWLTSLCLFYNSLHLFVTFKGQVVTIFSSLAYFYTGLWQFFYKNIDFFDLLVPFFQ